VVLASEVAGDGTLVGEGAATGVVEDVTLAVSGCAVGPGAAVLVEVPNAASPDPADIGKGGSNKAVTGARHVLHCEAMVRT
jgi:hypothetical protein